MGIMGCDDVQSAMPAQSGSASPAPPAGLPESRVLIISTGGTICMQQTPDGLQPSNGFLETALRPRPTFNDASLPRVRLPVMLKGSNSNISSSNISSSSSNSSVISHIDSLRTPPTLYQRHVRYGVIEFHPLLDSSSISASDWAAMASTVRDNYHLFDGFVILHGTDSLAYSASALSFIMANLGKPVILTGSQAPIFALQSDAVDNLLGSLIIAGTFAIPEVCLFFHHKLYRGNRTTKVSASSFEAFASPNCDALATVNGLGIHVNWNLVLRPTTIAEFAVAAHLDTAHVACLRIFPGIKPEMVDAVLHLPDVRGLILETFGMGNVPGNDGNDLVHVIRSAVNRGIVVVNVSQCVSGFVSPVYAPGTHLGRAGVIFGLDLTPEAALAKLSYLLAIPGLSQHDIAQQFSQSLRGEITELARPSFSHPSRPLHDIPFSLSTQQSAFTALGHAIHNADIPLVRSLLDGDGGQLLKAADYAGNTPVHLAAISGNTDIMLDLLKRGASVHERNRADNSALFLATLSGKDDCARLLKSAGAHLSVEELQRGALAKDSLLRQEADREAKKWQASSCQ